MDFDKIGIIPVEKAIEVEEALKDAGYAYFVKYGYMYYMRDMAEIEY